jgi:hypothetical protein
VRRVNSVGGALPSNFLDSGRRRRSSGSYKADPDSDNSSSDKKASFFLRSSSPEATVSAAVAPASAIALT